MRSANFVLIGAALVAALNTGIAQANTLTLDDADKFDSVVNKFELMTVDINQALIQAVRSNSDLTNCLEHISNAAYSASLSSGEIGTLVSLASVMLDSSDELAVLRILRIKLESLAKAMLRRREIINGSMALCSRFSTMNVKAQSLLNLLLELDEQVTKLMLRVSKAALPR